MCYEDSLHRHARAAAALCVELEWWAYLSFVFSFFVFCLCLNYVVKKINEAKIEERFIRMLQKASTTQSTQVNGPLIAVETGKIAQQHSPPGISLVFNQEENRRRTDPINLNLKNLIDKTFEISSLNAYKSMETLSIPSDDRTVSDSIPNKNIEFERVAAKATTSHILAEKVLVKNNEFRRREVKENSSITTKSDSYVAELITVKKNECEHVTGIDTLPVTRKDCNTSVFLSENETESIISRKISSAIHTNNVIQDVTAKKNAVRKESRRNTAEGTTSNEPIDSVAENVPLTNIYADRMVATNTRSIVEVTVKKPTVDKKSNEEIDSGCFIKKSVDSILSKITNFTNKNEDLRREKSATEVAKQPLILTGSSRNINDKSYFENKESSSVAAKETSHAQSDRVGENQRQSEPIVANETTRIERQVNNCFSMNMNVAINAAKVSPTRTRSDITVSQYFPIKRSESGSIAVRREDPVLVQETSHTRSDDNVAEISLANKSESSRKSVKPKSLREIVLEKNYEDTESDISVKKTEDSTVIAEIADTTKTTNDDPAKEISLTDKIKALLEDENHKDIMLNKPSSSKKK